MKKMFHNLHEPDSTLGQMVMAKIAQYVHSNDFKECSPAQIETNLDDIDVEHYGLGKAYVNITQYAVVKTYRLIQDQAYELHSAIGIDRQINPPKGVLTG
jgi:hypothetical protein